jgi:hypothetical protein
LIRELINKNYSLGRPEIIIEPNKVQSINGLAKLQKIFFQLIRELINKNYSLARPEIIIEPNKVQSINGLAKLQKIFFRLIRELINKNYSLNIREILKILSYKTRNYIQFNIYYKIEIKEGSEETFLK